MQSTWTKTYFVDKMPILAGPALLHLLPVPLAYYIPGVLVAEACLRTVKEQGLDLAV